MTTGPQQPTPPPPPGGAPATGGQPAVTETPDARIEGLRGWIAQLDRKLGVRTYAGAAAIVLALAAGIVGVVLATSAKDESATTAEVEALRDEVEAVQQESSQAVQQDIETLNGRFDDLEAKVAALGTSQRTSESEISVIQGDIDELRQQISDLKTSGNSNN